MEQSPRSATLGKATFHLALEYLRLKFLRKYLVLHQGGTVNGEY